MHCSHVFFFLKYYVFLLENKALEKKKLYLNNILTTKLSNYEIHQYNIKTVTKYN